MSESTKRSLRTLYQGLVAALVIVPILAAALADTGYGQVAGVAAAMVAAVAAVSKIVNSLEDAGLIPAWLKGDGNLSGDASSLDGGYVDVRVPIVVALLMTLVGIVLSAMLLTHPAPDHSASGPDNKSWAVVLS